MACYKARNVVMDVFLFADRARLGDQSTGGTGNARPHRTVAGAVMYSSSRFESCGLQEKSNRGRSAAMVVRCGSFRTKKRAGETGSGAPVCAPLFF